MDAKCVKCEKTEFQIKKREDQLFVYIICSECGTVAGVLEDIDFKEQHNKLIKNHVFFENRINELEKQIKHIEKNNKEVLEIVQWIANKITQK